jgi:hypothetical protein
MQLDFLRSSNLRTGVMNHALEAARHAGPGSVMNHARMEPDNFVNSHNRAHTGE